jgi:acyl-CoA synthetase (AMP-forming)/AMP-acid ligase II
MDANGKIQADGVEGEVVIRGDNVTKGYKNNEEANKSSFTNGWFRTGDQGYFDNDGYLKISGRLKEIINRGGEKISPLEIDNVLMEY